MNYIIPWLWYGTTEGKTFNCVAVSYTAVVHDMWSVCCKYQGIRGSWSCTWYLFGAKTYTAIICTSNVIVHLRACHMIVIHCQCTLTHQSIYRSEFHNRTMKLVCSKWHLIFHFWSCLHSEVGYDHVDMMQGCLSLSDWLSLLCLGPWINHMPLYVGHFDRSILNKLVFKFDRKESIFSLLCRYIYDSNYQYICIYIYIYIYI